MSFNCLQGWGLYRFFWQPVMKFVLLQSLKASKQISYFVLYLSWISKIFVLMDKIPLSLIQVSQPLLAWQMPQCPTIFVACPKLPAAGPCLMMDRAPEHPRCLARAEQMGRITFLNLLGMLCLMPKSHWPVQQGSVDGSAECPSHTPSAFSTELLSSLPQHVLVPGVLSPPEQDIAFAFAEHFSSLLKSLWSQHKPSSFYHGKLAEGALCPIIQVNNENDRRVLDPVLIPWAHKYGLASRWTLCCWSQPCMAHHICGFFLKSVWIVLIFLYSFFPPPTIIRACKYNIVTKAFWQSVKNRYHQVIWWFISSSN